MNALFQMALTACWMMLSARIWFRCLVVMTVSTFLTNRVWNVSCFIQNGK